MVHHVTVEDKAPSEIAKSRAKCHAAVSEHHHCVAPDRLNQLLAIDRHHLEGIGVDVEDMIIIVLIDDNPFLDRPKWDSMVDTIWVKSPTTDQKCELLVIGGGRKFRLLGRQRQATGVGDFLVTD